MFCWSVAALGVWIYVVVRNCLTAYQIHVFMTVLVCVKSLNLLCEAKDKSFIKRSGTTHGWDVLFYIFSFLKGIMLFTLIVLIGTGWSFLKPYLQGKEKKVLIVVIPLQVLANIATVVIDEIGPYAKDWLAWKQMFLLVDAICCCVVLFPIVWSIKKYAPSCAYRWQGSGESDEIDFVQAVLYCGGLLYLLHPRCSLCFDHHYKSIF